MHKKQPVKILIRLLLKEQYNQCLHCLARYSHHVRCVLSFKNVYYKMKQYVWVMIEGPSNSETEVSGN